MGSYVQQKTKWVILSLESNYSPMLPAAWSNITNVVIIESNGSLEIYFNNTVSRSILLIVLSQQSAENRPLKRKMVLQQMTHFLFLRTIGLCMFSPISINCFVYVCMGGGEGLFVISSRKINIRSVIINKSIRLTDVV